MLLKEFAQYKVVVDCVSIEKVLKQSIDLSEYDLLGIAYPVHAFNAPRIVIDFANHLPESNGLETFIIGSMGEDNPMNYASSRTLIKRLEGKGYHVFYNKIFEMPCNFIIKYKRSKVNRILYNVKKEIPKTANEIIGLKAPLLHFYTTSTPPLRLTSLDSSFTLPSPSFHPG